MGKVILGMTMSLDGFINDRNGDVGPLFPDFSELGKSEVLREAQRETGAVVMGRHAYEMGQGDYTDYEFQVPIFVLTHDVPDKAAKGENDKLTFTFVTDGIERAIEKAKAVADGKNVMVIGGASVAQQCIRTGLLDEIQVDIMPVLLGQGLRLFEHLGADQINLEKIKVIESRIRTYLGFRVVK